MTTLPSDEEIDLASTSPRAFATEAGARYAVRHPLAKAAAMLLASVYPDSMGYGDLYAAAAGLVAEHGDAAMATDETTYTEELLDLVVWGALRPVATAQTFGFEPTQAASRPCPCSSSACARRRLCCLYTP